MFDPENVPAANPNAETERLARVAAVEAQRIEEDSHLVLNPLSGKLVKPESLARSQRRAAERAIRDQAKNRSETEQASRLAKEQADENAARIKQERRNLLVSELMPPITTESFTEPLSDENGNDIPGTNWWAFVLQNLDDYLTPLERDYDFEHLYYFLAVSQPGRNILQYFKVSLLPELPEGWRYHDICGELEVCKMPHYLPRFNIWEGKTAEELTAYWQKHADYYLKLAKNDGSVKTEQMSEELKEHYAREGRRIAEELQHKNNRVKAKTSGAYSRTRTHILSGKESDDADLGSSSDKNVSYRCRICQQEFDQIPEGAAPIGPNRGHHQLFRFIDGSLHDLAKTFPQRLNPAQLSERARFGMHTRFHTNRNIQKAGCPWCQPQEQHD